MPTERHESTLLPPNRPLDLSGIPAISVGYGGEEPGTWYRSYQKYVDDDVHFVSNRTYDLLRCSSAALVTSGTATLETALLNVPEVVCYRGSKVSYHIGKWLIRNIKYISLVNLIMNKEVVKELIQDELTTDNLVGELHKVLYENRERILLDYKELQNKLGGKGASDKAAMVIIKALL